MSELRKTADIAPFGLRLPPTVKQQLADAANKNARSLNAEIVARLVASLNNHDVPALSRSMEANERPIQAYKPTWSDLELALLDIFRGMSVEKQLALISLFK